MQKEAEVSTSALFITLTYNDKHLPFSKNGYATLQRKDLQKFFKRLRKISVNPIRYYACGEYGSKTYRPHYHIILFNSNHADVLSAWHIKRKYKGAILGKIGNVKFRTAETNAYAYTVKYISKPRRVGHHPLDDRAKEFAVMSKGIGGNYVTEQMIEWHRADLHNRVYCPGKDDRKFPMARYYKNKIYTEEQRKEIAAQLAMEYDQEWNAWFNDLSIASSIYDQKGNYVEDQATKRRRITDAFRRMYETADKRSAI